MLSFFRRIINSKAGVIISFLLIATFALLFGMGDIVGLGHRGGATGDTAASVGKYSIPTTDVRARIEEDYANYQQQQPGLTLAQYVTGGGMDATVDSIIDGLALQQFAGKQGMVVSDSYVKGIIASTPAFQGADGKFDQRAFDGYLAQQHTSYDRLAQKIGQGALARQLVIPTIGAAQVPSKLALPYASLLLEKRSGQVALIPVKALPAAAAPTDTELAAYYQSNVARYTVPERRAIRYALITPETVKAQATPSDAAVAQAYQAQRAKYQPTEKRSLDQVVAPDQATAAALVAKARGGTSLADAARAAGLSATKLTGLSKTDYTAQSSPESANAMFAAASGALVGPVKTPLGYVVAKITNVKQDPGKTLDQAKPEIVAALTKTGTIAALVKLHDAMDDALNSKASFGDVVTAQKLTATTTPPLVASGTNPDDLASKPDAKLAPIVAAAFATDPAEGPQMVPIGQDGTFALVALDHVVAAAPRPLAAMREQVVKDFNNERAEAAAKQVAQQVIARVNGGASLTQALVATKLTLPHPQAISGARAQLAAAGNRAPPPLIALFGLNEHKAKSFEAPDRSGFLIVALDSIERGDATGRPNVVAAISSDLAKSVGREYVEQFQKAVRASVGVSKNDKALAGLKATLSGQGNPDQQ